MATLLESGARPYGSRKGVLVSMVLHGALITLAVAGTAKVVLPPREKVEEHPILYVAAPPPKPIEAPKPLPEVKAPPKAKAPEKVYKAPPAPKRVAAQPRPVPPRPAPAPQPTVPATPALVAPVKVPVTLAVNVDAPPTITDVVAPPIADPVKASGISREGSVKSSSDGDVEGGRSSKGLGSGDSGRAYEENQVERAVQVSRLATPKYPESLESVGVEGMVAMRFIVGTDGKVEPGSIQVIDSPHALFTSAVRQALLNTRYRPAEAGGRAVRQLVEQTFSFKRK